MLKFAEHPDLFYTFTPGQEKVQVYNGKGEFIEEVNIEGIQDILLVYCAMLSVFPWEE